ncbi:LOW QUALITY PROTEIN: hypothetical protein CsSME_00016283 [Camellia sinensis var. sinensis]
MGAQFLTDLYKATKGFKDQEFCGVGGFGNRSTSLFQGTSCGQENLS